MVDAARRLNKGVVLRASPGQLHARYMATATLIVSIMLSGALQLPLVMRDPLLFVLNLIVTAALASTGYFVSGPAGRNDRTAFAFITAGVVWGAFWIVEYDGLAFATRLAGYASSLFWIALGLGVLLYPSGRLNIAERLVIATGMVLMLGVELAIDLIGFDDKPYADLLTIAYLCYSIALSVAFFRRLLRSSEVRRKAIVPIALALTLVGVTASPNAEAFFAGADRIKFGSFYTVMDLVLLTIPIAFTLAWVRPRLVQASLARELEKVSWPAAPSEIRECFRIALGDKNLEVYYPSIDDEGKFIDSAGSIVDLSRSTTGRFVVKMEIGRKVIGILSLSADLEPLGQVISSAASAGALALYSAQLHAGLLSREQNLRHLHRELEEARWQERRTIERNLHDGVQHRLSAISAILGSVAFHVGKYDLGLRRRIENVQTEVSGVLQDVRSIAHGIAPEALSESGLSAALEPVVERHPIPVELAVTSERFAPVVEAAAYFVILECLANTLKHASARRNSIVVQRAGSFTEVVVSDNGVGGIDTANLGSGLRGIAGRLKAIGGSIDIESSRNGTTVKVAIPCE